MVKLLKPEEVAKILNVSRRTAYEYMRQMPHMEEPFRVAEEALEAWIRAKTVAPRGPVVMPKKPARRIKTDKSLSFVQQAIQAREKYLARQKAD
jgi:predicted DNA-binding transcriptional regulator AlpA